MRKAKHAFGMLENIDSALLNGLIDNYDILFMKDADGNPHIGWIDANGEKVILQADNNDNIVVVESLPESGETGKVYIFGEDGYFWNGTEFINLCKPTDVSALETAIATKANAEEVEAKIGEVDAKIGKYMTKMYGIAKAPDGTLVDYFDKEIRIMIPSDVDFTQDNGVYGDENIFYIEYHTYAPENAVNYKINFGGMVSEGAVEDFSESTDEFGRIYIANAMPVASYDTESAAWVYYGVNSTTAHYIGWNQIVEWYDENDVMIGSDTIRVNLSNEDCHFEVKPYYIGELSAEVDTKIAEKIEEVEGAIEVVEF